VPQREEFVVGWTDPEGSRSYIGALLLGYYTEDGRLHYAGRAGTGMTDRELKTAPDCSRRPCYPPTTPTALAPVISIRLDMLPPPASAFARVVFDALNDFEAGESGWWPALGTHTSGVAMH
jgi:ATP dependent DNA ligase C terminal region